MDIVRSEKEITTKWIGKEETKPFVYTDVLNGQKKSRKSKAAI